MVLLIERRVKKMKKISLTDKQINFIERILHDADVTHDFCYSERRLRDSIKKKLEIE